jgi:hypothetical protein
MRAAVQAYTLEKHDDRFLVTNGGRWPLKDLLLRVGKVKGGRVHLLRVLVNDNTQRLLTACGAPIEDDHLITPRDATCAACLA